MTDLVKIHPNERIDLGDFEHAVGAPFDEVQRVAELFLLGVDEMRILDGFVFTIVSPTTASIALGSAFLAEGRDGAVRHGQLTSEGVASANVSFAGLPVATYGVWVRFQYADGETENRAFWDANAGVERVQSVATRRVASWSVVVSAASPGGEWYKLYDVSWDGSDLATSLRTDLREFFFEGKAPFTSTWGGGDDRDSNRALHGVKSLERFCAAVLQKLDEIQSGTNPSETHRWWEAPAHGSLDDMLPLSGSIDSSRYMRGPIEPNATGLDLGSTLRRWDAWLNAVQVNGSVFMDGADMEFGSGGGILITEGGGVTIQDGGGIDVVGALTAVPTGVTPGVIVHGVDLYDDFGTAHLGTVGNPWFEAHVQDFFITSWVHGNLTPEADDTRQLGSGAAKWADLHVVDIHPTGVIDGNLVPNATGLRNLGSSSVRWATLYAEGINLTDRIIAPEATLEEITSTTNPAATTAYQNTLVAKNIPKAWVTVTTNGAGGVTVDDGFNVASAVIDGGQVKITFAEPFANSNYCVVGSAWNISNGIYGPIEISIGDATFMWANLPSSNLATQTAKMWLVFFGTQ